MLRVNLKLKYGFSQENLMDEISKILCVKKDKITFFKILKKSIDARKKPLVLVELSCAVTLKENTQYRHSEKVEIFEEKSCEIPLKKLNNKSMF